MKFEIRCRPEPSIYRNGKLFCSFAWMDATMKEKLIAAQQTLEALNAASL